MRSPQPSEVPVFILCGGLGTRLGSLTADTPKPMIDIGDRPMIVHIMSCYARFGFRRFVLCTGYRADVIGSYFLNFPAMVADFTIDLPTREVSFHQREQPPDWQVTVAFTGTRTMTGGRLARACARYLGDAQHFAVTYGDGLTDADLADELTFHLGHDAVGTVLGVQPPSRFGRFELHESGAWNFAEKPKPVKEWVNGGFFVFRRAFLDYLSPDEGCVMEDGPLRRLTEESQLRIYTHPGFWSCIDTPRDREEVQGLWEAGAAPWKG